MTHHPHRWLNQHHADRLPRARNGSPNTASGVPTWHDPDYFAAHWRMGNMLDSTPSAWGSETRIRSCGGAVVLVDEPAEQIPSTNDTRTDGDRVPRFGQRWG